MLLRSRCRIGDLFGLTLLRLRGVEANQLPPQSEAAIAKVVAHQIDRDPRQPREYLAVAAKALLLLKSADKALLRKLFRQIRLTGLRQHKAVHPLLVQAYEFVEICERRLSFSLRSRRCCRLQHIHRSAELPVT